MRGRAYEMESRLARRLRRRLGLSETEVEREAASGGERSVIEEVAAEFTTEELQEFLEADRHPVKADPEFKEALRERLWRIVLEQSQKRSGEANDGSER